MMKGALEKLFVVVLLWSVLVRVSKLLPAIPFTVVFALLVPAILFSSCATTPFPKPALIIETASAVTVDIHCMFIQDGIPQFMGLDQPVLLDPEKPLVVPLPVLDNVDYKTMECITKVFGNNSKPVSIDMRLEE